MKKKGLVLFGGICLILTLVVLPFVAACAAPAPAPAPTPAPSPAPTPSPAPAPAPLPEVEIKLNLLVPPQSVFYKTGMEMIIKYIEEAVPRAKVTVFPASSLVKPKDAYVGTQEGIVDFCQVTASALPGVFPLDEVFMLPGLFPNMATSNVVMNELYRKYPAFEEQFSPKVKLITPIVMLRGDIHSRVPIRTLDDLKGKVIGAYGKRNSEAMAQLGASVTTMATSEMYTPLEKGVVDGVVVPWGVVASFKLYEVAKYHTLIGINPGVHYWLFNRDTWDKFTPEEQQALEELGIWIQYGTNVSAVESTMGVLGSQITPEKGQELIYLSAEEVDKMRELFSPIWNKWAEDMEAKGYPAKDIIKDAERLTTGYYDN